MAVKESKNTKQDKDAAQKKLIATAKSKLSDQQKKRLTALEKQLEQAVGNRNSAKEGLQNLRIGLTLDEMHFILTGSKEYLSGKAEGNSAWGAYISTHLAQAGYGRSKVYNSIAQLQAARRIVPDDSIVLALINYKDPEKGIVLMVGGDEEKPFGKYTKHLQEHTKVVEGKVDLGEATLDEFVCETFLDPEKTEALDSYTAAVNSLFTRIWSMLRDEGMAKFAKDQKVLDEATCVHEALEHVRGILAYVLLSLGAGEMIVRPESDPDSTIVADIRTIQRMVADANAEQQKKLQSKAKREAERAAEKAVQAAPKTGAKNRGKKQQPAATAPAATSYTTPGAKSDPSARGYYWEHDAKEARKTPRTILVIRHIDTGGKVHGRATDPRQAAQVIEELESKEGGSPPQQQSGQIAAS